MKSFSTLCHFRQHLRCRWRILRSLLCVQPAEMQRSSAGSPETGEAWRRAFTRLTTCTWRRRMAKGLGLLQNNLIQSFSQLIVALMIDPVCLSCHIYIFLLIVCLCLFLMCHHQGVSNGRQKTEEVQDIQLPHLH